MIVNVFFIVASETFISDFLIFFALLGFRYDFDFLKTILVSRFFAYSTFSSQCLRWKKCVESKGTFDPFASVQGTTVL